MNWLYKYKLYLLLQLVHHVSTLETSARIISNDDVSTEIPKPIPAMDFEKLDAAYKQPRKLNQKSWQTEKSKKPSMVDIALQVAAREGINAMTELYQNIEPQIVKNGQILENNHPAALLSKFSAPVEGTERSAMAAFATLSATKAFRRNNKESTVLGRQAQSQKVSFRRTPLEGLCPPRDPPTCMPASQRYRTHDGTCNNRRRLRWGSAQMPFNRFLPPEYGDGVESIRGSVEGGSLSSARFVSLLVHGAREGEAPLTQMIVQWGQLLDHDLTSTAQPRSINGSVPSCCGSKDFHPSCFPIKVPLDDPWLAPLKVRCLEFLRSAPAQRRDCVLSWREQTNQVTSYIDASPIYSSNAKTSDNARIFRNGLLIYGRGDPADDVCMRGAIAHQCIRSGDGRSGEQPGLLALHHVWVGEHNRIAMELSILNPHWSDEKVYQETRRIIGALFQHITYREFLPIVLGREVCKLFDLDLVKSGFYSGYDPNTNPSVSNAFAAAAFRFGHSLVQNSYMRCDRNHNFINNNVTLHEEFQQGDIGTAGSLHRLLRGLATQKALKRDEFITPELTNHLFQTPGFPFGLDLAAINIQRGRDHGIAPYTAWRQPCGLSSIDSWDDLTNIVGPESAKRISHAYRNVHDIDLFVGGIAERPVIGGLVGPTFACIIAQQFSNSRKGDRFWYENSGFESSFTPAQLNSLRHVSLSSVLCRAINGGTLQPHVFIPNDVKGNQRVKCGKDPLEPIDLRPWLEQDPFLMSNENNVNLLAQNPSLPSPISTQPTKEEKGISNRIQNVTMVSNVDFIPNSSIGFHRVPNMTKIHDKLDMAQKLVTRPITQPIRGINNKLDKNRLTIKNKQKPTVSSLSKRISTTRRTVVIHNVEIELRSASGDIKEQKSKKKKTSFNPDSIASTAQKTILKVAGVVKSQISAAMGFLSDNDNADDETKHSSRKLNDQSPTLNMTDLTKNKYLNWSNKTDAVDDNSTITGRHFSKNAETGEETTLLATMTKPINKLTQELDQKDTEDTTIKFNLENIRDKVNVQSDISTEELNQTSDYEITTNEPLDPSATRNFSPTRQNVNTDEEGKDNDQRESKNKNCTNIETSADNETINDKLPTITESVILNNYSQERQDISCNNQSIPKYVTDEQNNLNLTISPKANPTSEILLLNGNHSEQFEKNFNFNEHETEPSDNSRDSHDTYKDFQAIIESALQDPLDELKRVHRKSDHKIVQVKKVELHTNLEFADKLRTLRSDKTKEFTGRQLTDSKEDKTVEIELNQKLDEKDFTEPNDDLTIPITTEQPATSRNIEHRQFQERPIYNRPQKLILDAPHTDQYEIEINIRQTNTKPPKTNANYEDYNSPHKRYDTDRYNQHFDYTDGHNTPSSNYYTKTTRVPYGTRTKPPTIIYIDEHEHDDHITTRNPGFFQNIISFASNGLNGIKQQTTTTTGPFNQNPNRISNTGHVSGSDHYSSSHSSRPYQHSKPSSGNYLNAQPPQPFPPNQGFPQHGFSQGPPNFNPVGRPQPAFPPPNIYPPQALPGANSFSTASSLGGVSHASSSAVSSGHFGAIAGSAASSGGDSTFSFNIRPSPRPQLNLVSPTGIKPDYELLPQRRPQYSSTPNYAVPPKPMPSVESFQYPPNKHDPFSSYTRRPPSYYDKIPNNVFDPAYDDIGRSELKIQDGVDLNLKSNQTDNDEDFDIDDYDYNDDDNTFSNILNNDNVVEERESNKDEKLEDSKRGNPTLTNGTKFNMTELDDNFVLPALRENNEFIQPKKDDLNIEKLTSFPTIEQKSLNHEIFAEDYDELLTARSAFLDSQASAGKGYRNKVKKPIIVNEPVAFAPIQILTKPERPDNWVIYDTPDEKPLLPVQPDYNTETLVAAEVPMPFQRRIINRISTSSRQTTTTKNDNKYSTEDTASFDITTAETDEITNQPTISQDDFTNALDLTKDTNDTVEVKTTNLEHK